MCKKAKVLNDSNQSYDNEGFNIILTQNFNFNTLIEITPNNKNYDTLNKIVYYLKKHNKSWEWLSKNSGIKQPTLNSYLFGKEYVTLRTIEKIIILFNGKISSPRDLINLNYPVLKGGKHFDLNIKNIMDKYRINRGDVTLATGIDNGNISCYYNKKIKQIRIETLTKFYDYFKQRGVPLNYISDLVYFKHSGETPFHFISETECEKMYLNYF
jgi:hypothetical protein